MLRSIVGRLVGLVRRRRIASDLDEEIRAHYDELRQALEDEGHGPAESARLARLRLGGPRQIRESSHDEWRLGTLEGFAQDLRLAARSLRRRPGFAAAAIVTLALGIGASTAIFSVAYGVSLRPLPYPDGDRVVRLYESNPATDQLEHDVSDGAFHAWRRGAPSLASVALVSHASLRTLAGDGPRIVTMSVSPAFFDVIGVRPMFGPGFKPEAEYTRFTTTDAILSHRTWQRLFAGRRDIIGAPLTFTGVGDDDVFHVVGVLPERFDFTEPVDVWFPQMIEEPLAARLLNWRYGRVIARLAPGATIDRVRAELEGVAARMAREFPASNRGWTVTVESLHDSIVGQFGRATWMLLASVAVVLMVACLNVGGLLTARAMSRTRETAVRVSLGAGSWRLLRLWLAEAALIGIAGAGLGLLLASLAVTALKAAAPPGIPRLDAVALDSPTFIVMLAATLFATVVFAAAPFARTSRGNLTPELRMGSAPVGERRERRALQTAVIVAQCAGATALVILAVMLTRSFIRLTDVDLGWDAAGVLAVDAAPTLPRELRRPWFARLEWSDRLIARLEATPGVERAALTTQLPLGPAPYASTIARGRGKAAADGARWPAIQHKVTDGYFALLGIRLTGGRMFGAQDRFTEAQLNSSESRPDAGAAIVTEQTARILWPGRAAIGQSLWFADDADSVAWREVIGIVEDIQFAAVGESPGIHVFLPWTQDTASARIHVLIAASDSQGMAAVARDVVRDVAPGATVDGITPLDDLVLRATAQPRFTSRMVAAFGALALALAAVGIYGTLAYVVGARTREIGVRLALGAPRSGIVIEVLRRGLVPALAGGLMGLAAAVALAQMFRTLLFGIEPLDGISSATGGIALLLVVLAAALGPARRASRVDPVRALRAE